VVGVINSKSKLAQQFYEEGKACPIYDFHGHMHELAGGSIPRCSPEDMARLMDRVGIKRLVYASHFCVFSPSYEKTAHQDVVRAYPNHFRAYHGIMARYTDFGEFKKNIEENPDVYVGAKYLGDSNGVPADDEILKPFWEYLHEKKMFVLLHTWGGSPYNGIPQVENLARNYPGITVALGHSFHGHWKEGMELAIKYKNLYYELTATHDDHDVVADLARNVSSERMLFGTDLPWFSSYVGVASVLDADITDGERENIFYKNAQRLSERFEWLK
jgi:predicted TIM-barrel fold metal-dependent hydrolase